MSVAVATAWELWPFTQGLSQCVQKSLVFLRGSYGDPQAIVQQGMGSAEILDQHAGFAQCAMHAFGRARRVRNRMKFASLG